MNGLTWEKPVRYCGMNTSPTRFGRCARALFLLVLFLTACTSDSGTWERIQKERILRVGLDPTYPPFEIGDENGLRGIDVDLAEMLADEMGLTTEFIWIGYDGLYDGLLTGKVDLLISALVIMPSQMDDFAYSIPYFDAGERLIVPIDSDSIDIDELSTIAVELGAQGHVEAMAQQTVSPMLQVLPYNTAEETLTAVLQHKADGAVMDGINGRLLLQSHPDLRLLPDPVTTEPFAIVVRKDDQILLRELNEVLGRMGADGRLDNILLNWLDK